MNKMFIILVVTQIGKKLDGMVADVIRFPAHFSTLRQLS